MTTTHLARRLGFLSNTPLHPQWLAYRAINHHLRQIGTDLKGIVLDIGCADKRSAAYLTQESHYIGLDYLSTAENWYQTRPDVYGDAQTLPFADHSVSAVLFFDVIEHLPEPDKCLAEIYRILKPNGKLLIRAPFLYPMHDEPLDFLRWTKYGLHKLAIRHGFDISQESPLGTMTETSAMLSCITLTKLALNWLKKRSPMVIFLPLIPLAIAIINIIAWALTKLSQPDHTLTMGYYMQWNKTDASHLPARA